MDLTDRHSAAAGLPMYPMTCDSMNPAPSPRSGRALAGTKQTILIRHMMQPHKNVLTTGEVAKICNVAPRTVSKWFDAGHLRGYRIPGGKDRRIPLDQLVRFMRAHGIPLNGLDSGSRRVLIFDADPGLCAAVGNALVEQGGFDVSTANTALEAGALACQRTPDVMVVDVHLPDAQPRTLCRFVRSTEGLAATRLIGMGVGLADAEGQALLQDGFDGYLSKPFSVTSLIRLIEETTGAAVAVESN